MPGMSMGFSSPGLVGWISGLLGAAATLGALVVFARRAEAPLFDPDVGERRIDELNADLAPLRSFILPGGSPAGAYLHLARTVCRRAERIMVELNDEPGEGVTPSALKYVNRLSDFLFVAGRHANDKGASDVLWQPGQNR